MYIIKLLLYPVRDYYMQIKFQQFYCMFAFHVGTHGTGLTVGNLASFAVGLRFISGEGKVCNILVIVWDPLYDMGSQRGLKLLTS